MPVGLSGCAARPLGARIGGGAHLDSRYQRGVVVRTIMPQTVDEKRRRAVYTAAYAAQEIVAHLASELAGLERVPQRGFGKPEIFADQENRCHAQPALVSKQ